MEELSGEPDTALEQKVNWYMQYAWATFAKVPVQRRSQREFNKSTKVQCCMPGVDKSYDKLIIWRGCIHDNLWVEVFISMNSRTTYLPRRLNEIVGKQYAQ